MSEATPRPWAADPDWREGYSWNIHIVQAANPHMRICFMTSDGPAQANADLIIDAVNNYDTALTRIRELEELLTEINSVDEHGWAVAPMNFTLRSKINAALSSKDQEKTNG